jgi:hypothetical protein
MRQGRRLPSAGALVADGEWKDALHAEIGTPCDMAPEMFRGEGRAMERRHDSNQARSRDAAACGIELDADPQRQASAGQLLGQMRGTGDR